MRSVKTILIVKNRAIGDSILGLSSISYLKDIFPDVRIIYGVPSFLYPLYREVDTDADLLIPWSANFFKLKRLKIGAVIELQQRKRTARFLKFYSFLTGTPYFYHNHHLKEGDFVPDQGKLKPIIQRDLDGVWAAVKALGQVSGEGPPHYLKYSPPRMKLKLPKTPQSNLIILGVQASRSAKIWPLSHFARLCKLLVAKDKNLKIVIPLDDAEEGLAIGRLLQGMSLPPQVSYPVVLLDKLPECIAGASLFLGNDSALKHLAAALGVKTCTIFGIDKSHPTEWHPYDTSKHSFFHFDKSLPGNLFQEDFDPQEGAFLQKLSADFVFSHLELK